MNKLNSSDRARILHLLCECNSRAITLLTGASKNTVTKLLIEAGKICMAYHDATVRGVTAKRVRVDEIWSLTCAKQRNVASAKAAPDNACDTWTWTAIQARYFLLCRRSRWRVRHVVHGRSSFPSRQSRSANE